VIETVEEENQPSRELDRGISSWQKEMYLLHSSISTEILHIKFNSGVDCFILNCGVVFTCFISDS
jgi:hypothetical protein